MALAKRRYPFGAELIGENERIFVLGAKAQHVDLVLEESAAKNAKRTFHPLEAEKAGISPAHQRRSGRLLSVSGKQRPRISSRSGFTLSTGWAARFFLGCRSNEVPMDGPERGRVMKIKGQIMYEMHIGNLRVKEHGARRRAVWQSLARIGITVVEMCQSRISRGNSAGGTMAWTFRANALVWHAG